MLLHAVREVCIVIDRVEIWSISGHADRPMFNNVSAGGVV